MHSSEHLSTRQYERIVDAWVSHDWFRSNPIWNSYDEKNEAIIDIQKN
jgi:hypothetical protein